MGVTGAAAAAAVVGERRMNIRRLFRFLNNLLIKGISLTVLEMTGFYLLSVAFGHCWLAGCCNALLISQFHEDGMKFFSDADAICTSSTNWRGMHVTLRRGRRRC